MNILAIETSCDETACAVVGDGVRELASVVASSKEFHEKTGGVVPEIAARKQVDFIVPVIDECLNQFGDKKDIDAIAVTVGPGLVGSLIVGIEAAKALSLILDKPLIPVNHLIGHIYANFLVHIDIKFPAIALIVSGGHTDLVFIKGHGELEFLGGTLDDAAGEAFDKTARILGLSNYLGGVLLSQKAATCETNSLAGSLPRPLLTENSFDFSFSGLKTATKNLIDKKAFSVEEIACEFQEAVVDVLVEKTVKAAKKFSVSNVLLGGGVAANGLLRENLMRALTTMGCKLVMPPIRLCGDNAVYIASAAFFNNVSQPLADIVPNPSLGITSTF